MPLFLFTVAVAVAGFFWGADHYNESPDAFWRRIVEEIGKRLNTGGEPHKLSPKASLTPEPAFTVTPAPTPVPTPAGAESPSPRDLAEQNVVTPPLDPISWLLDNKAYWPKEVVLLEENVFPIISGGKSIGTTKVPAGVLATVEDIGLDALTVTYGSGSIRVPSDKTDIQKRAMAARALAEEQTKAMPEAEFAREKQSTTSSPQTRERTKGTPLFDELIFGDKRSEESHLLRADRSEITDGAMAQPARLLVSGGNFPWEGGNLEWTMKVDPKQQNYVTVKLWGSDKGYDAGRLVLYVNGLQAGYRHESDLDVLNESDGDALAPGRFVYATLPLPPKLTHGKTSVDLKIVVIGAIFPYGTSFEQYQKSFFGPSRGIYRAYTHAEPRFVPDATEVQGKAPVARKRATDGDEVIDRSREIVNERIDKILTNETTSGAMGVLSEAYDVRWTPAYKNQRALDLIVAEGDSIVQNFLANPDSIEGNWMGAGSVGVALMQTWPDIKKLMDDKITINSTETTRGEAWSRALQASMEYWRTHRRAFTNQAMFVDSGIYYCNRGLQLIDPGTALPEDLALRYIRESVGILPFLGSDLPDGGHEVPFGKDYHLITRKGLSRELGYVGTYGETILPLAADIARLSGDKEILEQLRKMQLARHYFRYPGLDEDGFRCMKLASEIDNRTALYPKEGSAYNGPHVRELWGMETAALLPDDTAIVGVAQQGLAEGQYFPYVKSRLGNPHTREMMRNADDWEKVRKLPKTNIKLPMTPGQPDCVFSDEENAVLAIKHGETSLFINFYFRAHYAVNRIARVFETSPTIVRLATVRPEVEVIGSGETYVRGDQIDWMRGGGKPPPGQEIHQAWSGEELPIARRPADASNPKYGEFGPFVGKAALYSLQYGDYLIGMNTTEDRTYSLPVPSITRQAWDLVAGKKVSVSNEVKVGPLSTVVLYLGKQMPDQWGAN